MTDQYIDIVFDGPPSDVCGRFVEVENEEGASISTGEWINPESDPNFNKFEDVPFWRLRLKLKPGLNALASIIHEISTEKGFTPPDMENLPQKLMLSVSELAECMEEHRKGRGLRWYSARQEGVDMPVKISPSGTLIFGNGSRVSEGVTPKPEGVLPELADSIIRNLHMMHSVIEEWNREHPDEPFDGSVEEVIMEKIDFNRGRPFMHGDAKQY